MFLNVGLLVFRFVRTTDQEMTFSKNANLLVIVPKMRGFAMPCKATWENTRVGQDAALVMGTHEQRVYYGFHR